MGSFCSWLRKAFILIFVFRFCLSAVAQVNMSSSGSYVENFNSLSSSAGTSFWYDDSTVANWYVQRTGSGTGITTSTGSSTPGDLYNYGSSGQADRALGSLGSGSAGDFAIGLLLQNNSQVPITNIVISFIGEQWRKSGGSAQTVSFYYKVSSTSISSLDVSSNSSWTAVSALDYTSPVTGGTAGLLNGNLSANRVEVNNVTIPSLNLAAGDFIMLKWEDPDHSGTDHGLALDSVIVNWTVNNTRTDYYLNNPSSFGTASSWNTLPDGSGSNLPSLTDISINLIVDDDSTTMTADLVLGANSGLIVGDGSSPAYLGINNGVTYSGGITVSSGAILDLKTGILDDIDLDSLYSGSQVWYTGGSDQDIHDAGFSSLRIGGNGTKFMISSVEVNADLLVMSSAVLDADTFAVKGSGYITLEANSTLILKAATGMDAFDSTSGASAYSSEANYVFRGDVAQVCGTLFPGTVNDLTITNSSGVNLSSNLTVNGELDLNSGFLSFGLYELTLASTVAGTGTLRANGNSNLNITGSGNLGTISMDQSTPGVSNRLNNLTFNRSSSGTISLGSEMQIKGVVTHTDGTLQSNGYLRLVAIGAAQYGQVAGTGNGAISGAMCMQMLIPGTASGWRNFCSPLDTVTLGQLGTQLEIHVQNTAPSGDNRNVYQWDEIGKSWSGVTSASAPLHNVAYNIYLFKDQEELITLCGLYSGANHSAGLLSFTSSGNPANDGWHLVANPYPSALDWNSLNMPSGAAGNYAVWSVAAGNYKPWNGSTGSAGQFIPPMHAFWVKVNTSLSTAFEAEASDRVTNTGNHFAKNPILRNYVSIKVRSKKGYEDEVIFYSADSSGNSVIQAEKLPGLEEAPSLWVEDNGKKYSIRVLETGLPSGVIPLAFHTVTGGECTMEFAAENLSFGIPWLEDRKNGKWTKLTEPGYVFQFDEKEASTGRFYIHLNEGPDMVSEFQRMNDCPDIGMGSDFILLDFSDSGPKRIELYNINGRLLYKSGVVTDSSYRLPLSEDIKGMLILSVEGKRRCRQKIIRY